jgi:hypothetical protein
MIKRGSPVIIYDNMLPPLHIASYSLLRNMRDALKGTTLALKFACDTLNTSSWFPFQPMDELLNLKAVQSL